MGSLATTLGINLAICAVVVIVFGVLRKTSFAKKFYAPKLYISIPFRYKPNPLPDSVFTWWQPLNAASDDEVYACAGMDALTYIHYLRSVRPNSFVGPGYASQLDSRCWRRAAAVPRTQEYGSCFTTNSQNHLIWTPWCGVLAGSAQAVWTCCRPGFSEATPQLSFRRPNLFMTCNYV
jgi:hypothetical protein